MPVAFGGQRTISGGSDIIVDMRALACVNDDRGGFRFEARAVLRGIVS